MDDNTTKVWISLLTLVGSIVAPLVSAAAAFFARKVRKELTVVKQDLATNTATTNETHNIVNSERTRMTEEIADLKKQLAAVMVTMEAERIKHPAVERAVAHVEQAMEVAKESP